MGSRIPPSVHRRTPTSPRCADKWPERCNFGSPGAIAPFGPCGAGGERLGSARDPSLPFGPTQRSAWAVDLERRRPDGARHPRQLLGPHRPRGRLGRDRPDQRGMKALRSGQRDPSERGLRRDQLPKGVRLGWEGGIRGGRDLRRGPARGAGRPPGGVRHRVPVPLRDRGCQSDLSDGFWREIPRSSRTAPRQRPGTAPRPDRLQPVLCGPGILRAPVPYREERLKSLAGRFPGRQPHRWLVAYCRG